MRIEYSRDALKFISKQDKPTIRRIIEAIEGLTETPPKGDIKRLQGGTNECRLRVGKYRVIYEYTTKTSVKLLMVNRVDSRGDVYK